jgi:hypothetical protein
MSTRATMNKMSETAMVRCSGLMEVATKENG